MNPPWWHPTPHQKPTKPTKNQLPRENQTLLSYSKSLPHAKPTAQQFLPPPPANHNLNDQSNGPANSLLIPYHPPKMRKSNSSTPLKPPSTLMLLPTTTQPMSQQNHNQFWLPPLAVKPYHASATHNTINIMLQPAIPALALQPIICTQHHQFTNLKPSPHNSALLTQKHLMVPNTPNCNPSTILPYT